MTDDAAFQRMLDEAQPSARPAIYGVYSDWLQEYGDETLAAGYRWMHQWGKAPMPPPKAAWAWWEWHNSGSTRWHSEHPELRRPRLANVLPMALWLIVDGDGNHTMYATFPSRVDAELAVCRAIHEKRYRPRWRKVVA